MEPPARESVKRVDSRLWILGLTMICSKITAREFQPLNSIVSWQDGDSTFYLLPRDQTLRTTLNEGDSAIDRIQECGTGGSVWGIGNEVICKVKSWCEGRQLEATTISFVRENCPDVPVPEVIHSWTDRPLNRTYLILKRVHARTLNTAWPHLSADQRSNIADEIAQHCSILTAITSCRYETVSGFGVLEYSLMGHPPVSNPTWLPMTLGPFSSKEMKNYMTTMSSEPPPELDESFHFYHPDLGPTNILVSDDGNSVATIIDWEAAAYFPRFWVATKPASNWAFRLGSTTDAEKNEWAELLVSALEMKGFNSLDTVYLKWNKAKTRAA
ncbi:MAG: hypothetical protein Q9187_008399 [Circinaria calcarea]